MTPEARRWRRSRRLVAPAIVLLAFASYTGAVTGRAGVADEAKPHVVFEINAPEITESSSLVVSTSHPGLVYTANDSGDSATIYVLDASTGALVGHTSLSDVVAVDIEAMAAGMDGSLLVADIGDNGEARESIELYRIPQPTRGVHEVVPDAVALTYSDGSRDAESVVYDSRHARAYVVSKEAVAHVYATPPHVFARGAARLRAIGAAPAVATDATMLPGQQRVVVRTYLAATAYSFPSWRRESSFALPLQGQGESVAAPPGGRTIWIGTEGSDSQVLEVRLPARPQARQPGTAPPSASPALRASQGEERPTFRQAAVVVLVVAAVAFGLVVGIALVLRRRDHRAR